MKISLAEVEPDLEVYKAVTNNVEMRLKRELIFRKFLAKGSVKETGRNSMRFAIRAIIADYKKLCS